MRQLFTLGFWMSLLALAAITVGLLTLTGEDDPVTDTLGEIIPTERSIDIIAMVFVAQADPGFTIVNGRTTGALRIQIDGFRHMDITPGTPGENRCPQLAETAQCAVAADLLGEAVLWFSIVPLGPRNTVALPAVSGVREGSRVQLVNGWLVRRTETVERECDEDTNSLTDFINRFGDASTATFSLDEQAITTVTCPPQEP
jgi:hypothetical protein